MADTGRFDSELANNHLTNTSSRRNGTYLSLGVDKKAGVVYITVVSLSYGKDIIPLLLHWICCAQLTILTL